MRAELTSWELYLHAADGEAVRSWRVGLLVSRWLEGHLSQAEHRAPPPGQLGLKPYAVGPVDSCDGLVIARVGVVGIDNAERLLRGAAAATTRPARLGPVACRVVPAGPDAPARLADHGTFAGILDAARPATRLVLVALSPTRFRGSDEPAVPHAQRVFGSLRRRWRAFADTVDVNVDFDRVGLRLEYAATRTVAAQVHRNRRVEPVEGFTGLVSYLAGTDDPDTEPMRRGLHALARLGDFLGVGSSTVQGLGAAKLLAVAP